MDRGRSRGAFLASDLHPFGPGALTGSLVEVIAATPGIFQMFGTTIRSGRGFTERDDAAAPHVAVINRALAIELFGAQDAQGRKLLMRQNASAAQIERITVVGVVGDTVGASGRVSNEFYVPFAQHFSPDVAILAKTRSGDIDSVITKIRTTVRQIDPDVAVSQAGRADLMTARYGAGILRLVTRGAAALAIIALVLAMTGLYGVLSHVVSQRVRELGLRMALGADRRRIVMMILKDGFRPVVEGLFIGLAVAAVFRMLMPSSLEMAIGPADLIAFAFAAGPLLVAGAIACYFPAHRAASVDPNVALRNL
jgi:putative ABC transport system permease protein